MIGIRKEMINMKRICLIVIGLTLLFSLGGCTQNNDSKKTKENQSSNVQETTDSKSLVLYFSATGNTKSVAEKIQGLTDSDIIEIEPKESYTSADLNYNNDDCRANQEQNDDSARPEIKNTINIAPYKTIYLGYPIWWGDVPKIILTLMDNYDFSGKTVILFCTSGGSDITTSVNTLKEYKSEVNFKDGQQFGASVSENEIKTWLDSINN